jgi:hypothetical protein
MVDFESINRAALAVLPAILRRLLPDGRIIGGEYVALNPTRSDRRPGSFKINLRTGRWSDFATGDKGGDPVSVCAYVEGVSQGEAARLLAKMLGLDTREARHHGDDRFEPLTESELTAAQAGDDAPKDEGECVMPVSPGAPRMPSEHPKLGKPSDPLALLRCGQRAAFRGVAP